MSLDLTTEEARFLSTQIDARVQHLENELVHTDKRSMQHDIALDVAELKKLGARVKTLATA